MSTKWYQKTITLSPKPRGSHLITTDLLPHLPELARLKTGLLTLTLQHTTCALTLNENYDFDVRLDMSDALDRLAPESARYRHADEGPDDMPSHVKCSLLGASVTVPITDGRLRLGTWQGVWFCEFRNAAGGRKVVATIFGEEV